MIEARPGTLISGYATGQSARDLERLPSKWTHLIGTQLKIKELEHVFIEKYGS
jgi:hypothetical protein